MGIGDLSEFRFAGSALAGAGLVHGAEGNLSVWDGERLWITRTGCRLADLGRDDVLEATIDRPPVGSSSDLEWHLGGHRLQGPGAIVHAHPPGTVPEEWQEGQPHGVYASAPTLIDAVVSVVATARHGVRPMSVAADSTPGSSVGSWQIPARPIHWMDGIVSVLDQTRLPAEEHRIECKDPEEIADAIRSMAVRGAPVLGLAAAFGVALAAHRSTAVDLPDLLHDLDGAGDLMVSTRPTAVNIRWAVGRVLRAARSAPSTEAAREVVLTQALTIQREDAEACSEMSRHGAAFVSPGSNVLTHCNTGMLCTAGIGTALGVVYRAHLEGKGIHVWVDETRPVWQGARLTAWELLRIGVPMTLVADAAAGSLMAARRVDVVIVGADRIAGNGDVANKIGTYALAVLARHHGLPFLVVAPASSVDLEVGSGEGIVVEERAPGEVTAPLGVDVAPTGAPVANPAFDVTPAALVTAVITERGVVRPPYEPGLRAMVEGPVA